MRILIVEDEPLMLDHLTTFFSEQNYAVDSAQDGEQGWFLGSEINYDLAIIDVGLPKLDGIQLTNKLRGHGVDFPILILTARGLWHEKVEGLEAGADDYLTKPFHFEELKARVDALLRRANGSATKELKKGPIRLDLSAKTVELDNQPIELTSYEYRTLEYLMLKPQQVVSKTELTEHLYDQDFDRDSNVIEVFIGRLRKKLDPTNQLMPIATVRGQGYKFVIND
ncbi:response regulator transcription factor [Vibrio sp. RC27]